MNRTLRGLITLTIVSVLSAAAFATAQASQWLLNGTLASAAQNNEQYPDIVSDGAGGAIVVWMDSRTGQGYDIWAQRFDAWGRPVWAVNGVALCAAIEDQYYPSVISDGAGGAIVVWKDLRTSSDYDIYAQRVSASGSVLWAANGVAVCTSTLNQEAPQATSDGAGGAIFTWHDVRSTSNWDIYAQRVSAAGSLLWTSNGKPVCTQVSNQFNPKMVADGTGGAFVVWEDFRTGAQYDLYAQRIDDAGNFYWNLDGIVLCNAPQNQVDAQVVSDNSGGALVVWEDSRSGVPDTFAQRLASSGTPQWAPNGVSLASTAGGEYDPQIASDGSNGAVIVWYDQRSGNSDIYVQRVDISGAVQWGASGAAVCTAANSQDHPHIAGDGFGGAVVSWLDQRVATTGDVYARRVNAAGVPQGTANGVPLCVAIASQMEPRIATDGEGGGIVAWEDGRTGGREVYVQRLERFNNWGYASPDIVSASDVSGDQGGQVNLSFGSSRFDPWPYEAIDRYTVWRAISPSLAAVFLGSGMLLVNPGDPIDPDVAAAIRVENAASETYYWQLMSTVDAYHLNGYAQTVATLFDSTATTSDPHYFQVIAHSVYTPQEYWISAPASGRSLDNLAPAASLTLTAQRVGSDILLDWNSSGADAPDFQHYAVYRASTSGVQPVPGSFVTGTPDTLLTDVSPPPGFLYYIVTAVDVHSNQSAPSNEVSVTIPTGVGDTPRLTGLALDANFPNPFSAATTLRVGLPRQSDIVLDVYDVAGRRVAGQRVKGASAGWQSIAFDGRDATGRALPSGVYFYRVQAGGETQTRKMVIRR